ETFVEHRKIAARGYGKSPRGYRRSEKGAREAFAGAFGRANLGAGVFEVLDPHAGILRGRDSGAWRAVHFFIRERDSARAGRAGERYREGAWTAGAGSGVPHL